MIFLFIILILIGINNDLIVEVLLLFFLVYVFKGIKSYIDKKAAQIGEDIYQSKKIELEKNINQEREKNIHDFNTKIKWLDEKEKSLNSKIHQYRSSVLEDLEVQTRILNKKQNHLENIKQTFTEDFCKGRKWLAELIAESQRAYDEQLSANLENKKHPAYTAAEAVRTAKAEKRAVIARVKFLEYQLKSYKEYFPFLEEFEYPILSEKIDFLASETDAIIDDIDRSYLYLEKDEYLIKSPSERNQIALDRYLLRPKDKWEIGRLYERYLGYLYETDGWGVNFIGAIKGYEDMGRDLICTKGQEIRIIQAKCWSNDKTIHEKHIFQLFGTTLCYEIEKGLPEHTVKPVFVTTTNLSDIAKSAAIRLGVIIEHVDLSKSYPMIKCNINQGNKIYHLPFDQQYDRVKITDDGELYVHSVIEAEKLGFRRAKKYFPTN